MLILAITRELLDANLGGEDMADVLRAYRFLNDSLKLGLSDEQLMHTESALIKLWLSEHGYPGGEEPAAPEKWEFFSYLKPKK